MAVKELFPEAMLSEITKDLGKVSERKVENIPVKRIRISDEFPVRKMSDEEWELLKENIEQNGIIEPLVLVWDQEEDLYWVADGRHRYMAACILDYRTVPAVVYTSVSGNAEKESVFLGTILESVRKRMSPEEFENLEKVLQNLTRELEQEAEKVRERVGSRFLEILRDVGCLVRTNVVPDAKNAKSDVFQEREDSGQRESLNLQEQDTSFSQEGELEDEQLYQLQREKESLEERVRELEAELESLRTEMEAQYDHELEVELEKLEKEEGEEIPEERLEELAKKVREEVVSEFYPKLRELEGKLSDARNELFRKENEIEELKRQVERIKRNREFLLESLKKIVSPDVFRRKMKNIRDELYSLMDVVKVMDENYVLFIEDEWEKILSEWDSLEKDFREIGNMLKDVSLYLAKARDKREKLEKELNEDSSGSLKEKEERKKTAGLKI